MQHREVSGWRGRMFGTHRRVHVVTGSVEPEPPPRPGVGGKSTAIIIDLTPSDWRILP